MAPKNTRNSRSKGPVKNRSLIDLGFDQEEIEEGEEENAEPTDEELTPISMSDAEDVDPIWERLSRLPFFKNATAKRQEELYFLEKKEEKQEREKREEREFELRKLELKQNQQGNAENHNTEWRPHLNKLGQSPDLGTPQQDRKVLGDVREVAIRRPDPLLPLGRQHLT
jgi:hypothetical protein